MGSGAGIGGPFGPNLSLAPKKTPTQGKRPRSSQQAPIPLHYSRISALKPYVFVPIFTPYVFGWCKKKKLARAGVELATSLWPTSAHIIALLQNFSTEAICFFTYFHTICFSHQKKQKWGDSTSPQDSNCGRCLQSAELVPLHH